MCMARRSRHLIPIVLAAYATFGARVSASPETYVTLSGRASLPEPLGVPLQGTVRMILRGNGDIDDDCPDRDAGHFVAEYDGVLVIESDGSFSAPLSPFHPPVATPAGCQVTNIDVHHVDTVMILAELPAQRLDGQGRLTFQTLSAVDNDDLQNGSFGTLHAELVFQPRETP
jgi:hypothetical protein